MARIDPRHEVHREEVRAAALRDTDEIDRSRRHVVDVQAAEVGGAHAQPIPARGRSTGVLPGERVAPPALECRCGRIAGARRPVELESRRLAQRDAAAGSELDLAQLYSRDAV